MKLCRKMKIYYLVAALLAIFSDTQSLASLSIGAPREPSHRSLGELDLRNETGEQVSLIPYISRKPIVVVFWAAWCRDCRSDVPRINYLNDNPRIKVVAINEGDSNQSIKEFVADNKVGYQVVIDPAADVAKAFGVPSMPYCVVIDRSGVVVYRGHNLPEDIEEKVR